MTQNATTRTDDPARQHLQALDEPELPERLWPRVDRARRQRIARMHRAAGGTALALLVLATVPLLRTAPDPAPQVARNGAAEQTRVATSQLAADTALQLRLIDRELQTAYRRGGDQHEMERLWQARQSLLVGRASGANPLPIRI